MSEKNRVNVIVGWRSDQLGGLIHCQQWRILLVLFGLLLLLPSPLQRSDTSDVSQPLQQT